MERRERAKRENRKRAKGYGPLFWLGTLALIGVCTAVMVGFIFMRYVNTTLAPTLYVDADDYTMEESSIIYYHDDEVAANDGWVEYQTIHGTENRIWVDFDQIPDAMWQAAVAIEDERFFLHDGVDWKRTIGATVNMFIGMKDTFGGSTITQQMLKNLTEDNDGTVNRKVREIFRALEFEKSNTKEEILELYLNMIYLGQGCYGVQTAAQFYFGKDVSELSVAECASLIAITNNPSLYGPMYDITYTRDDGTTVTPRELNKQRQLNILKKMSKVGLEGERGDPYLTQEEYEAAKDEVLQFTDGSTNADEIVKQVTGGVKINSWFVDQVIWDVSADLAKALSISEKEARILINSSGYRIYTTMDRDIQEIAESVYADRSNLNVTSGSGQQLQSGITIMDPYTGDIVAIVGKVGEKDRNLGFSCATAIRQPGSSIKPLTVYAPAIELGAVNPGTAFDDYPVQLMGDSAWPKNSPNNYRGWTNVRTGVQHSINTIAVQTLQAVGTAEAFAFATEKLNLSLVAEDMDISPLGMGGLTYGLSTVEMAAAYSAFVNSGTYTEPRTYLRVEDAEGNVILENESESHVAMKETTATLMNDLLKNAVNAGTGTSAKFSGMTIAGKTGTTTSNKDRYFVGYTPYYVAAVWTGYENPETISYRGNPAITMWKKVMEQVHADLPNKDFARASSGLTTITVCADSGLLCTDACHADLRGDRAISVVIAEGTAPTEPCNLHTFRGYCSEGKCLATALCPASSVKQVGLLNCTREDYGASIVAEDDLYTTGGLEKAMGLTPTATEDGVTEDDGSLKASGCPVHTTVLPVEPEPVEPPPGGEETTAPTTPTTPTTPTAPTTPVEPSEPSGGTEGGEDWWGEFWPAA